MDLFLLLLFVLATILVVTFCMVAPKEKADSNKGLFLFLATKIRPPWGWIVAFGYVMLGIYLVTTYK